MLGSKTVFIGHVEVSSNTAENGGTTNQPINTPIRGKQVELSRVFGLEQFALPPC